MCLWATSATVTKGTVETWAPPAFLFYDYLFAAVAVLAIELVRRRGRIGGIFRVRPRVYALGVFGLFGYAFLYTEAFARAGAVEVSLINYLWPLMVVVFAVLILREPGGWPLLAGAAVCFGGLVLLAMGKGLSFTADDTAGCLLALSCAVVWGLFSVLLRRFCGRMSGARSSHGSLFILVAFGAAAVNFALRGPFTPPTAVQLAGAAYIGVATTAGALLLWETAMRGGRAAVIGLICYFTPLLSTPIIWLCRPAERPTFWALGAAICITAGAMLPLLRDWKRRRAAANARPPAGPPPDPSSRH
jgi:drug/metabolite transporter (DMT)-like permease